MWWGLHIGVPYDIVLDLPFGELLDLIAIERVRHGELKLKTKTDDDGDFWSLMEWK